MSGTAPSPASPHGYGFDPDYAEPHLTDDWLRVLDQSTLDPCPQAATEIRWLRNEVERLKRDLMDS
jgi:hypothetical protein